MRMYVFENVDGEKTAVWPDKVYVVEAKKTVILFEHGLDQEDGGWSIDAPFEQVVSDLEDAMNFPSYNFVLKE